jgi:hypothetical protein
MDVVTQMFDTMGSLLKSLKDYATADFPVSESDTLTWIYNHAHKIAELAKTQILLLERKEG